MTQLRRIILSLVIAILWSCEDQSPMLTGMEGERMPEFRMLMKDSATSFNASYIQEGKYKSIILFYYDPLCPYCAAQMKSLLSLVKNDKELILLAVTNSSLSKIDAFCNKFILSQYPNVITTIDTELSLPSYFGFSSVPFIAIYNREKNLKDVFLGLTGFNILLKSIVSIQ